jgi:hypothetical protein
MRQKDKGSSASPPESKGGAEIDAEDVVSGSLPSPEAKSDQAEDGSDDGTVASEDDGQVLESDPEALRRKDVLDRIMRSLCVNLDTKLSLLRVAEDRKPGEEKGQAQRAEGSTCSSDDEEMADLDAIEADTESAKESAAMADAAPAPPVRHSSRLGGTAPGGRPAQAAPELKPAANTKADGRPPAPVSKSRTRFSLKKMFSSSPSAKLGPAQSSGEY